MIFSKQSTMFFVVGLYYVFITYGAVVTAPSSWNCQSWGRVPVLHEMCSIVKVPPWSHEHSPYYFGCIFCWSHALPSIAIFVAIMMSVGRINPGPAIVLGYVIAF